MKEEIMKTGRSKIELLKLTFRKLWKKLKNKIKRSEGDTYNISLQFKSCEDLEDKEDLDYFKLLDSKVSVNTTSLMFI